MPRAHRPWEPDPVQTYERACAWLWTYSHPDQWAFEPGAPLPPEARLVCDTWWISPDHLRRDMRRQWQSALGGEAPLPLRRAPPRGPDDRDRLAR